MITPKIQILKSVLSICIFLNINTFAQTSVQPTGSGMNIGGFVGDNGNGYGIISNSFWDTETSGTTDGVGYSFCEEGEKPWKSEKE